MMRVRKIGVPVPAVLLIDDITSRIYMQMLSPAFTIKSFLLKVPDVPGAIIEKLALEVGKNIALTHNTNCIHGDLTTSNIMIKLTGTLPSQERAEDEYSVLNPENQWIVYMIDFGLSYISGNPEDMAVDLYVLERAVGSTHPSLETFVRSI